MASCSFSHPNSYGSSHNPARIFTLTVNDTAGSVNPSTNTSSVDWTVTVSGGNGGDYYNSYVKAIVNGTVVYDNTATWQQGVFPAKNGSVSGTLTDIVHDNDGTKTISFYIEGYSYEYTVYSADGSLTLQRVPRYANITKFTVSKRNETSVTVNWDADVSCDKIYYSINNGSTWVETSGYPSFVINGLSPNTTYNFKIRVRRTDSQLTTDSGTVSQTTYKAPTQSMSSKTETSITMNWSVDTTANYIWYSKDNGSNWTAVGSVNATSGSYTISGLTANTTYNIKTRVRRSSTSTTYDTTASAIATHPYPYLVSASNFTIGNNIPVNIKNPLNRSLTIYIIGNDNSTICTATRTTDGATNIGSTADEITAQYNSIPDTNKGNYKVRIVCSAVSRDTTVNGAEYSTDTSQCSPTFNNFEVADLNNTVVNVTGSNQVFVKGYSILGIIISSANKMVTQKGASPKNYVASCDTLGKTATYTSSDITIEMGTLINSGTKRATVFAYDSRTNSDSAYKDILIYDYNKPVINATVERLNNFENQTTLSVRGEYTKLIINDEAKNTILNGTYKYRETGGTWSSPSPLTITISDNYFYCDNVILSLDNSKSFEFEISITDKLDTTTLPLTLDIGKAIFFISSNLHACFVDGYLDVDGDIRYYGDSIVEYSTSEKRIGKWVDGKPIYRKTINVGTVPSNGAVISHNINNLSRVIKLYGSGIDASSGEWMQFPTSTNIRSYLAASADTTKIYFSLGTSDFGWNNVFAIIEYTKTTD